MSKMWLNLTWLCAINRKISLSWHWKPHNWHRSAALLQFAQAIAMKWSFLCGILQPLRRFRTVNREKNAITHWSTNPRLRHYNKQRGKWSKDWNKSYLKNLHCRMCLHGLSNQTFIICMSIAYFDLNIRTTTTTTNRRAHVIRCNWNAIRLQTLNIFYSDGISFCEKNQKNNTEFTLWELHAPK